MATLKKLVEEEDPGGQMEGVPHEQGLGHYHTEKRGIFEDGVCLGEPLVQYIPFSGMLENST